MAVEYCPRMVKRTRLPADIRARLPRLADALRGDPRVVAVYLFGSLARDAEGPLSDVDVAILLAEPIDHAEVPRLALDYTDSVLKTLGTDEVSVVMLNTASLTLRHRVIRDGQVLLDRAPVRRRDFEVQSQSLYLDFKPVLDAYDDELLRQLQNPSA
jgi:predicted nucleotidyltransferase